MYLLNPVFMSNIVDFNEFTFHYVSIKSLSVIVYTSSTLLFTFHYVSIKSDTGI